MSKTPTEARDDLATQISACVTDWLDCVITEAVRECPHWKYGKECSWSYVRLNEDMMCGKEPCHATRS